MSGKVYRVNMAELKIEEERLPEEYRFLSGRALTSRLVTERVDPSCDPRGRENMLVLSRGLLAGTPAACSGRMSIGGKSPLTGGIKEANSGGTMARALSQLDIKALIIEGMAEGEEPYILLITEKGLELRKRPDLKGLWTYKAAERLREELGGKASIALIGPPGENLMSMASIALTDRMGYPCRMLARGGLGAVMGSKGLKGIAVVPPSRRPEIPYEDEKAFMAICREWTKTLVETKKGLRDLGTPLMVAIANELGGFPSRNFRAGRQEGFENITGERMRENILARGGDPSVACMDSCPIRCASTYHDNGGNLLTTTLEYETIALIGGSCSITNLDDVARMDRLAEELAVDTIELGNTLAVAAEGGLWRFGDGPAAIKLVEEIGKATLLGRVLGQGAYLSARVLGVRRIPTVKRQGVPGYDPRCFKGMGVTYSTSPMGADHTAGPAIPGRKALDPSRELEVFKAAHQPEVSRELQAMIAAIDSLGFCFFVGVDPDTLDIMARLVNHRFGSSFSWKDLYNGGVETLRREIEFNNRAGIGPGTNYLPDFMLKEALPPKGHLFDVEEEGLARAVAHSPLS